MNKTNKYTNTVLLESGDISRYPSSLTKQSFILNIKFFLGNIKCFLGTLRKSTDISLNIRKVPENISSFCPSGKIQLKITSEQEVSFSFFYYSFNPCWFERDDISVNTS